VRAELLLKAKEFIDSRSLRYNTEVEVEKKY
jgi:hypothetical protein